MLIHIVGHKDPNTNDKHCFKGSKMNLIDYIILQSRLETHYFVT